MNLKDTIKTKAQNNSYEFKYGSKPYLNFEILDADLKDGNILINMLPEIERAIYTTQRPIPSSVEYSVFLQVAKKWESGNATYSNLDETYEQKYDLRLGELYGAARNFVKSLACQNNWEMVSYRAQAEINQYSTSLELISVEFVFRTPQFVE